MRSYFHMTYICICACWGVCVCVRAQRNEAALREVYANCCCLNTQGPAEASSPYSTRPSNKASRLVSLPCGPLDNPHQSLPPKSILAQRSLCLACASRLHGWQVNEEKIFLQDHISTKPWEPMAALLWASALRLGTFISSSSRVFTGRRTLMNVWHRPQVTDLQSDPQPLISVLKPHLRFLTARPPPTL